MSERQIADLLLDCSNDRLVAVTEAGNRRAATHIQVLIAGIAIQVHALPANSNGVVMPKITIKN
jgi:hypothetical protein